MARLDHDAANARTKRRLIAEAAAELPRTITSRYPGTCARCGHGYLAGAPIQRHTNGWQHPNCTDRTPNAADRLQARRQHGTITTE